MGRPMTGRGSAIEGLMEAHSAIMDWRKGDERENALHRDERLRAWDPIETELIVGIVDSNILRACRILEGLEKREPLQMDV